MAERHSEFERDADDWYCEPASVVERLLERVDIEALHDPCCGKGNIVDVALARGIRATGSDLRDRAGGRFPQHDFLHGLRTHPAIVTNPPFKIAAKIVERALQVTEPNGVVAIVAQAKFLFSQARHALFNRQEFERVIVFSRRPSMPPGAMLEALGEACRGGGSMDYVWCVWRVAKPYFGATVEWTL